MSATSSIKNNKKDMTWDMRVSFCNLFSTKRRGLLRLRHKLILHRIEELKPRQLKYIAQWHNGPMSEMDFF